MSPITENPKTTQLYRHEAVYFRLALVNKEHTLIDLYDSEGFKSAEEAKAHGESAEFRAWTEHADMVNGWVVVKESHSTEEVA